MATESSPSAADNPPGPVPRTTRALARATIARALSEARLDVRQVLEAIVRSVAEHLGDGALVQLASADGRWLEPAAMHDLDPEMLGVWWEMVTRFPMRTDEGIAGRVYRGGTGSLITDVDVDELRGRAKPQHVPYLERLRLRSSIMVPLRAGGRILGVLGASRHHPGAPYDSDDLDFLQDVADRAGLAVENARLYEDAREQAAVHVRLNEELRALTEQRTAGLERVRTLQTVTELLGAARTVEDVAATVVDHGVAAAGARAGVVVLLASDGQTLEVVGSRGYSDDDVAPWRRFPADAPVPLADAVRLGEAIWIGSTALWEARYPAMAKERRRTASEAITALPLVIDGRAVGSIGFSFSAGREFDDDDRAYLLTLARQCSQAVERVRLFAAESEARERAEAERDRLRREIAERLEIERALAVSEERFRSLVQATTEVVWTTDGRGAFVEPQPSWEQFTGQPWPRHRGWGWIEMLHPDDRAEIARRWTQALESGATYESSGRVWHAASGAYRYYVARAVAIPGADGAIREWIGTIDDVDTSRRMELQNAQLLEEAQAAVRARDEFLSIASHELKTPLTSLRGFAQIALRQLRREGTIDAVRLERTLTEVERQTHRLDELIRRLLDVSRIQSGRLVVEPRTVDLRTLIDRVVEEIGRVHPGLPVEVHGPSEVLALADPPRVEQVVRNLLDNAARFSPPGGMVEVEVGPIHSPAGGRARLAVRDRGVGVPPEQRSLLFGRFHQAHPSDRAVGMGLGLYISREIVAGHGGDIRAEFPIEGGSRFIVELPAP